jgi:hypothetical protein
MRIARSADIMFPSPLRAGHLAPGLAAAASAACCGAPCDGGGQEDRGQEDVCTFVVAGGNSAEILEPAEHPLDDVAAFVGRFVVSVGMFAGRVWWDHGLDAPFGEFVAKALGIVSSVGE